MITTLATARVMIRRVREERDPKSFARERRELRSVLFPLGRLLITPGALELLAEIRDDGKPYSVQFAVALEDPMSSVLPYLRRHATGDWGDVDRNDWKANDEALTAAGRVFSAYDVGAGKRLWIITEADRSSTTALLPDEY